MVKFVPTDPWDPLLDPLLGFSVPLLSFLTGLPLSDLAISGLPLATLGFEDFAFSALPLFALPLSALPLSDFALSGFALSDLLVSDFPFSTLPLDPLSAFAGSDLIAGDLLLDGLAAGLGMGLISLGFNSLADSAGLDAALEAVGTSFAFDSLPEGRSVPVALAVGTVFGVLTSSFPLELLKPATDLGVAAAVSAGFLVSDSFSFAAAGPGAAGAALAVDPLVFVVAAGSSALGLVL